MVVFRCIACLAAGLSVWAAACLVAEKLAQLRLSTRRLSADELLADPTLAFVLFAACGAVLSCATSLWVLPVSLVIAFVLAKKMPQLIARRDTERLRSVCDSQLDGLADIVAMGVRAGLSFDATLDLYCERFTGQLARQMRSARVRWQSGAATREHALADLARKLDSRALKRFSETVVQAIRYGSPLADMLTGFADELRRERQNAIEKQVAKAPVKMFLPLGACILPATILLVAGPVFLQFLEAGA